jgi:hypothetical protein
MKPVGVQLRRRDGTVIDCELVHKGVDEQGMDLWLIANAIYQPGDQITVEQMPAMTGIGFRAPRGMRELDVEWTEDDGTPDQETLRW